MPKTSVFVNGRTLSVDNQTFNVKFNKSIADLQSGLSKAQKAIGLFYNQNQQLNDVMGRCVNAQGKCVEGLTQAQIKLGQYVDEEGKVRTENGGFGADLTKIEQALGFYASEYGNRL